MEVRLCNYCEHEISPLVTRCPYCENFLPKQKKSSIREKLEDNLSIFFFSTLFTGFIAGIVAYDKALDFLKYSVVQNAKIETIEEEKSDLKQENARLKDVNQRLILSCVGRNDPVINAIIEEEKAIAKASEEKEEQPEQKQRKKSPRKNFFVLFGVSISLLIVGGLIAFAIPGFGLGEIMVLGGIVMMVVAFL